MTLPLRVRLAVASSVVFGALLAAVSTGSYRLLARQLDDAATSRLSALTSGMHGYLRIIDEKPVVEFDRNDSDEEAFVHEATQYYQVYDVDSGRLLVQSVGLEPLGLQLTPAEVRTFAGREAPFDISTDYGRVRLSNSLLSAPGGRAFLLQVGVSLKPVDEALRQYRELLWWRTLPASFVALFAAWWLAGFALKPLTHLAAAARAIDVTHIERRLPVRAVDDELTAVARAFNETLARVDRGVGEMRQFSAALAHELRTPLTALRGEIELSLRRDERDPARRAALASQIEELDRLKLLIDHILTLARAESGQIPLTFAPLDLGTLAATLVEQLEPVAQARTIALSCERPDAPVLVSGDAGWLQRLLLNLIDNALKFTTEGGRVVVRIAADAAGARIEVADTGMGIPAEAIDRVFERFFRADPARSSSTEGAGLGLSLVRWIVERHAGAIRVDSPPGEGATFVVTLPIAPAVAAA